jgi:hypothetical protein
MLVSAVEPVAQVRRCFIGRFTVEGHHRRRHARYPDDMGAPAFFGDPRHFNDEGSTRNSSFETVPHDCYECSEMKRRSTAILRSQRHETSETKYEGAQRLTDRGVSRQIRLKKNFVVEYSTGLSPFMHSFSTRLRPSGFGDAGA